MRKNKNALIIILIILALAALFGYLFFDHALIYFFAKAHHLDVTFKKSVPIYGGGLTYGDMTVLDRKTGMGFLSELATFKPSWDRGLVLKINLRGVHFLKKDGEKPAARDSLSALVSTPFSGRWVYNEIKGEVRPSRDSVRVGDLTAVGDQIKLKFTGDLYFNNTIRFDIVIYFSDKSLKDIPAEASQMLLTEEGGGWKSLSVHLEGNYSDPSIRISSRRFRLNINTVTKK